MFLVYRGRQSHRQQYCHLIRHIKKKNKTHIKDTYMSTHVFFHHFCFLPIIFLLLSGSSWHSASWSNIDNWWQIKVFAGDVMVHPVVSFCNVFVMVHPVVSFCNVIVMVLCNGQQAFVSTTISQTQFHSPWGTFIYNGENCPPLILH